MLPPIIHKIAALVHKRARPERRGAKRLTPSALTPCLIRRAGENEQYPAWIHNLSRSGIGVLSPVALGPDTMIQVVIINAAHTFALSGEVKIVRCTRVVNSNYLLGGEFTNHLQHDEMVPFIV